MLKRISSLDFAHFKPAAQKICSLSIPIVIINVTKHISYFITMIMIAQLGHAYVAAGALINAVIITAMIPLFCFFHAVSAVVGQHYGARRYTEIGKTLRQSMLLGALISLPLMVILRYVGHVLIFFGQDPYLSMIAEEYFRSFAWGVSLPFFSVCITEFFISIGKQKLSLMFSIFETILLVALGYILVFGKFGVKAFGLKGAGYAINAANAINLILIIAVLFFDKAYERYRIFEFCKKDKLLYVKEVAKIGWPIACMAGGELMIIAMAIMLYGWLGEASLAAQNITMRLNVLAFMIAQGIGQAAMVLISQEIGAKKYNLIRNMGYSAMILGVLASLLVLFIYSIAYKPLIGLFLDLSSPIAQNTFKVTTLLLILHGILNVIDFPRFVAVFALRGLRDTVVPMLIFVGLGCA